MRRYLFLIFILLVVIIGSCYYDNEEALYPMLSSSCDTTNVTYSGTIFTLLSNSCYGCHGGSNMEGGISLSTYSKVQEIASSGKLMNALKGNGVPQMPLSGPLPSCKVNLFNIWINKGMPNK